MGVLLAAPGLPPAAVPAVTNCLTFATNTTLLPALLTAAAVATPAPLLVYLTSNVTLGAHPVLPASGVAIRRPVVFVGLQSLITSIDFEMVVNQLNASAQHSNTTFVGLALENLAPGDGVTSAVAAPFSIAVVNNVWAVYYNRCVWLLSAGSQLQQRGCTERQQSRLRPLCLRAACCGESEGQCVAGSSVPSNRHCIRHSADHGPASVLCRSSC